MLASEKGKTGAALLNIHTSSWRPSRPCITLSRDPTSASSSPMSSPPSDEIVSFDCASFRLSCVGHLLLFLRQPTNQPTNQPTSPHHNYHDELRLPRHRSDPPADGSPPRSHGLTITHRAPGTSLGLPPTARISRLGAPSTSLTRRLGRAPRSPPAAPHARCTARLLSHTSSAIAACDREAAMALCHAAARARCRSQRNARWSPYTDPQCSHAWQCRLVYRARSSRSQHRSSRELGIIIINIAIDIEH